MVALCYCVLVFLYLGIAIADPLPSKMNPSLRSKRSVYMFDDYTPDSTLLVARNKGDNIGEDVADNDGDDVANDEKDSDSDSDSVEDDRVDTLRSLFAAYDDNRDYDYNHNDDSHYHLGYSPRSKNEDLFDDKENALPRLYDAMNQPFPETDYIHPYLSQFDFYNDDKANDEAAYVLMRLLEDADTDENPELEVAKDSLRSALRARCQQVSSCMKRCPVTQTVCPKKCRQNFDELNLCQPKKKCRQPKCGRTMPPRW